MTLTQESPPCSGVVYNDGKTWLPLIDLDVYISIVDTSSRVLLTQTYFYEGSQMLQDAYYMFPLPPDAAVCGFQMRTNDGTSMEGIVKEVNQARQDYEEAVRTNRLASLLEQFQHDIFVLSLGSFLPRTEIAISISFVMDLSGSHDNQDDAVRFLLPTFVGHRYGIPPSSRLYTLKGTGHTASLSIILDVQMSGRILDVRSNYCLEDVPALVNTGLGLPHQCRKRFKNNQTYLHEAFMVIIQAMGLDGPRCFAETWEKAGTAALSLTLVPRFNSAQVSTPGEFIFLIDRSGSMSWDSKLDDAKEALKILLHTVPQGNSWFNLYAFDHSFLPLWSTSQKYDNMMLDRALEFSRSLTPGGGTELLSALSTVLNNRMINVPTNLFVLTDGQVVSPNSCIDVVRRAVSAAATSNSCSPIRVFTLAFGHDASIELCEGLAIAGNGFCSLALEGKQLMQKCVNAMGQMMSNRLQSLEVDWCVPESVHVRQTPSDINAFPGKRETVLALVPKDQVPNSISVLATLPNGFSFNYQVPVQTVQNIPWNLPGNSTLNLETPRFLHVLTAHGLILDLERNISPQNIIQGWTKLSPVAQSDAIQQEIITLGLRYQLASSRTAFIVAETHPTSTKSAPTNGKNGNTSSVGPSNLNGTTTKSPPSHPSSASSSPSPQCKNSSSSPESISNSYHSAPSDPDSPTSPPPMPSLFPLSPPPPVCVFQTPSGSAPQDEVIYFLGKNVPPAIFVAPPSPLESVFFMPVRKLSSFISRKLSNLLGKTTGGGLAESEWDKLNRDTDSSAFTAKFGEIAQFQGYDGRFSSLCELCDCLGCATNSPDTVPPEVDIPDSVDREAVWTTALALAFLRSKFPEKWLVWKDFARKSLIWGEKICGSVEKFDLIIERARSFL